MLLKPLRSAALSALVLLSACSRAPQAFHAPPPEVQFVQVRSQSVPLTREIVGRLSAVRTADVRARVAGILLRRLYREGAEVTAGQPLFQIDPAPFKAALDAAKAALAQAQANAKNAHMNADRDRALLPSGLISKSDYDTAIAAERSTAAAVKLAQANVESARINLGYATVRAPISGLSGEQAVTVGALVGQGSATLLTTIEQINYLYVNFDRAADDLLRLRSEAQAGQVTLTPSREASLEVILPNGVPYPEKGVVDFSAATVDPTNGQLTFRGIIPNPQHMLLPGMFVHFRLLVGHQNHAFLVSQAAVRRDTSGAYVMLVGPRDKVERRTVVADTMSGTNWIVTKGLRNGDRVIVSGVDKVKAGMTARATPRPASSPGEATTNSAASHSAASAAGKFKVHAGTVAQAKG